MSQVRTFINNVTVAISQLPPPAGQPVNASFVVTPDPAPGNPFGPTSTPNPNNSFTIWIPTIDPQGCVPPDLIAAQLVFVFTPLPTAAVPNFTINAIAPNRWNSQPLYRGDQVVQSPNGSAAVILTIPKHLSPIKTKTDYSLVITAVINGTPQNFVIDPDINVEVQN